MALVREPTLYESFDPEAFAFDGLGYHEPLLDDGDVTNAVALLRTYSDPASNAFAADNHWAAANAGASMLAFDRAAPGHGHEYEECDEWIDAMDQSLVAASAPYHTTAGFDAAAGCFSLTDRAGSSNDAGRFGLLYHPSTSSPDAARASQKRPYVGAELQASPKKQYGASRKSRNNKAKSAPTTPTKDPQSLAAKNRRERISERLKILQELVPNGTKVDLVTMLEKAISYVKFLQLQVKVLATDEFWPAQGGKAPEISQVKEALDAILSSQRAQ